MAWQEHRVTWTKFTHLIEDTLYQGIATSMGLLFRGHGDSEWLLEPKLRRLLRKYGPFTPEAALLAEKQAFRSLLYYSSVHEIPSHVMKKSAPILLHSFLAHHGAPTRLLDWTYSPYIAAYFAVADPQKWDCDGAVFVVPETPLNRSSCKAYKIEFEANAMEKFMTLSFKDVRADRCLVSMSPAAAYRRQLAQMGTFTVCSNPIADHGEIIAHRLNGSGSSCGKLVIPKELKPEFLYRLERMNISAASLYPDLHGLGLYIRERMHHEAKNTTEPPPSE